MVLKISDINQATGKKLKTIHFSGNEQRLLLGFEDGLYCQFEVDTGYGDDSYWIGQCNGFDWRGYNAEALVQNGVLTAEWVANQKVEEERKRKQDQEEHERRMLILLKQKYESQESPDGV